MIMRNKNMGDTRDLRSSNSVRRRITRSITRDWDLYLLLLIPIIYFVIFKYKPMTSLIIAFKNYKFKLGYWGSPWAKENGLYHFLRFFKSAFFSEIMWNTVSLSVLQLLVSFPVPIILALIMNEMRNSKFKKTLQTVTYAPHFISTVVLVAIMEAMLNPSTGVINKIIENCGGEAVYFFGSPDWFKPLYILSGIWQNAGYKSIIYLAAMSTIDAQLIEAAKLDGANRFQLICNITLPSIIPTAVVLLIMDFGKVMNVGFEKAYLLQNDLNIRTSEVISTYIYKVGLTSMQYSYSTAVGLFEGVINIVLLLIVNKICKRLTETSLW